MGRPASSHYRNSGCSRGQGQSLAVQRRGLSVHAAAVGMFGGLGQVSRPQGAAAIFRLRRRCHGDDVLAILDVGHVNRGHSLVIAKNHCQTMMDLEEEPAGKAFVAANRVAKALEKAYGPDGMTILQANRPAGFQTVPHFHLHVLPRGQDDGVTLTCPTKNPPQDELAAIAGEVRALL